MRRQQQEVTGKVGQGGDAAVGTSNPQLSPTQQQHLLAAASSDPEQRVGGSRSSCVNLQHLHSSSSPQQTLLSPPSTHSPLSASKDVFHLLLAAAQEFAHSQSFTHFLCNPVAAGPQSQSHDLFVKGLQRLGYSSSGDAITEILGLPDHIKWAFHGTGSPASISRIFAKGWDTARRVKQVFGKGEYFDLASASKDFAGTTTEALILTLIVVKDRAGNPIEEYKTMLVENDESRESDHPIAIVNNPLPASVSTVVPPYSFCLPVAVGTHRALLRNAIQHRIYEDFHKEFALMGIEKPLVLQGPATSTSQLHYWSPSSPKEGKWEVLPPDVQSKGRTLLTACGIGSTGSGPVWTAPGDGFTEFSGMKKRIQYEYDLDLMERRCLNDKSVTDLCWM